MGKVILKKVSQLEYELSLLGVPEVELTGIKTRIDELKSLLSDELYSKEDMIESAEYGYNYHINTSFPDKSFGENCKNNFLQHLWAKNRNR